MHSCNLVRYTLGTICTLSLTTKHVYFDCFVDIKKITLWQHCNHVIASRPLSLFFSVCKSVLALDNYSIVTSVLRNCTKWQIFTQIIRSLLKTKNIYKYTVCTQLNWPNLFSIILVKILKLRQMWVSSVLWNWIKLYQETELYTIYSYFSRKNSVTSVYC